VRVTTLPWGPVDRSVLEPLGGGVTAVPGVRAAGVVAGLKPSGKLDLALVDVGARVPVAVTTTSNLVKAAPCVVAERHAQDGYARAVVINAGNANACTGPRGLDDAARTATEVAEALGCDPTDVLPLSTGIIGVPLPMDLVSAGIGPLVGDLDDDAEAAQRAALAICTTDTSVKSFASRVVDAAGSCTVAGFAKGAGMIEPAMATMLCVIVTDAPVSGAILTRVLRQAVDRTFNRISVDACGSTNDTVVLLATGTAGTPPSLASLQTGVEAVCADLAHAIVADGEGTTKVAAVTVKGAATQADAERLARAVTSSALFRAAVHGADPNWGRILAAMGAAGVPFEPARVHVACGGITVCRFGTAAAFDRGQVAAALDRPEVVFEIDLGAGDRAATLLTADLTPDYVRENAYYTT
jgi:glutamate N-acetyltransferase / amino-acid N-acetyltransferase